MTARVSGCGWPPSPCSSAVAAGLTPVGPALYAAVLEVNSRGQYFAEWQPPDFTDGNGIALLVLVGVVVIRLRRRTVGALVDRAAPAAAGRRVGRSTPTAPSCVAAMMLVPLAAAALQEALRERPPVSRAGEVVACSAGAVACLAVLALLVPRTADEPPAATYPDWLSDLDDHAGRHRRC